MLAAIHTKTSWRESVLSNIVAPALITQLVYQKFEFHTIRAEVPNLFRCTPPFVDWKSSFPLQALNNSTLLKITLRVWTVYPIFNLRPGGGGVILPPPPPLWFFEDNSKTKGSSVTKLGIPFHWSILHLLWNFCVGVTSGQVTRSSHVT